MNQESGGIRRSPGTRSRRYTIGNATGLVKAKMDNNNIHQKIQRGVIEIDIYLAALQQQAAQKTGVFRRGGREI